MKRAFLLVSFVLAVAGCKPLPAQAPHTEIADADIRSGSAFLTAESRAQQNDDFENPGFLWVEKGEALFQSTNGSSPSCQSCHATGLTGVAAHYPAIEAESGQLFNLESRINACRERHQSLPALAYESDDLLSLTAYVAEQSRGEPVRVSVEGLASTHLENGERYFFTKRGQFNFSCSQCHNENWGKKLRGDTISQGHLNGYPAYRLEWQSFGSSHRRLRDCDTGVRAEPLPLGDPTYIDVELYLAYRAEGLTYESPGIRR